MGTGPRGAPAPTVTVKFSATVPPAGTKVGLEGEAVTVKKPDSSVAPMLKLSVAPVMLASVPPLLMA